MTVAAFFVLILTSAMVFAGGDDDPVYGFKIKPHLQMVSQNSIGILWENHNSGEGIIKVSLSSNMSNPIVLSSSPKKIHKVKVQGLQANTRYYYTVAADTETSPVRSFVTSLPKGSRSPFRFAVYGDTRLAHWAEDIVAKAGDNDDHLPVLQSMTAYAPDFMLHVGDFVFDGNNLDDIYNFFDVEEEFLASYPMMPTYGNHEFKDGNSTVNTQMDSFLVPGDNGDFSYFSFTYGNVHVVVLNTGYGVQANDNYDVIKPGSAQHTWMVNDLQQAAADPDIDHIFVSMHNPPYSVAGFGDNKQLQDACEPYWKQYGVKIVFMGHEHDYQHQVKDGIHYVLSGGAGSSILDMAWHGDEDDSEADLIKYEMDLNYVIVDINGDNITIEARSVQGNSNSSSARIELFSL